MLVPNLVNFEPFNDKLSGALAASEMASAPTSGYTILLVYCSLFFKYFLAVLVGNRVA